MHVIGVEHTRKGGSFLLAQLGASRIISRLTERGVVSQRFVFAMHKIVKKDCDANLNVSH
jgi:hypothetical protein